MRDMLKNKADELMTILNGIPNVKGCNLYGSLSTGTHDELSDIDIEIDVSGYDNGLFMLELTELLKDQVTIYYSDYAPSLVPEKYIVSIAIDVNNPFLIVDLSCSAAPHCTTVTKQQVMERNEKCAHTLKVWTANLKHYVRGTECDNDIVKMAKRLSIADTDEKDATELLEETLCWLEDNVESNLCEYLKSCRRVFKELVK